MIITPSGMVSTAPTTNTAPAGQRPTTVHAASTKVRQCSRLHPSAATMSAAIRPAPNQNPPTPSTCAGISQIPVADVHQRQHHQRHIGTPANCRQQPAVGRRRPTPRCCAMSDEHAERTSYVVPAPNPGPACGFGQASSVTRTPNTRPGPRHHVRLAEAPITTSAILGSSTTSAVFMPARRGAAVLVAATLMPG